MVAHPCSVIYLAKEVPQGGNHETYFSLQFSISTKHRPMFYQQQDIFIIQQILDCRPSLCDLYIPCRLSTNLYNRNASDFLSIDFPSSSSFNTSVVVVLAGQGIVNQSVNYSFCHTPSIYKEIFIHAIKRA